MSRRYAGVCRSVADMPAQMRRACECLVAEMSTEATAAKMGIGKGSVQALYDRARKMTGVKDRAALEDWCRRGGNYRPVSSTAPYPIGTVRTVDNALVSVYVYSVIQMLREDYPREFLAEAARFSEARRAGGGA